MAGASARARVRARVRVRVRVRLHRRRPLIHWRSRRPRRRRQPPRPVAHGELTPAGYHPISCGGPLRHRRLATGLSPLVNTPINTPDRLCRLLGATPLLGRRSQRGRRGRCSGRCSRGRIAAAAGVITSGAAAAITSAVPGAAAAGTSAAAVTAAVAGGDNGTWLGSGLG